MLYMAMGMSGSAAENHTERTCPKEWDNLGKGVRFIDRFLPMPIRGKLSSDTWGGENVKPRDISNGIEDRKWSYWGGNILKGDDGKYHMFVCRWLEESEKGHREWPNSKVVHAVSENKLGPFKVQKRIGNGHNVEAFRLKDGSFAIYVIGGYYHSDSIDGPWKHKKFKFNERDRRIVEGLTNLSFTQREDGSYLMVCRGGSIWISKNGLSPYNQVGNGSVYPKVPGNYEDPVVWRDNIQYHMIVNDWRGRIAYYLRSKNGIDWKIDPGEAYLPGIAEYTDGTVSDWYKFERIKIFQDQHKRAIQANFAVIDCPKKADKGNDNHSSKNICIPLTPDRLMTILDKDKIDEKTKTIRLKIAAEEGFNPHSDIDIDSLRFGASEEVNFGRGSKVIKTEHDEKDLIVTFDGKGNGITDNNFAAKLLGLTTEGKLLFGYARLPWLDYPEAIISARKPQITNTDAGCSIAVEVQNFGPADSELMKINFVFQKKGKQYKVTGVLPALAAYEKTILKLTHKEVFDPGTYNLKVLVPTQETPLFEISELPIKISEK